MKRKAVAYNDFRAEVEAKNEAYHFILACGLGGVFAKFRKDHEGEDHHAQCVRIIMQENRI